MYSEEDGMCKHLVILRDKVSNRNIVDSLVRKIEEAVSENCSVCWRVGEVSIILMLCQLFCMSEGRGGLMLCQLFCMSEGRGGLYYPNALSLVSTCYT